MFVKNKYYKWYCDLTSKRERIIDGYVEKHHVIPKCMGGSDKKENLVKLTAREHYVAHLLLTKCVKKEFVKSIKFALWNMCNRDNGDRIKSSKYYENLRVNHAIFLSNLYSGENNPMFGNIPTEETRRKISNKNKGLKRSLDTRTKISEANKGDKNSMYGARPSDEHIENSRKRFIENNPMKNLEIVGIIKNYKKGTINCFDSLEFKFVRIQYSDFLENKDRYKNNNSKEAKEFRDKKEKQNV